MSAKLFVLIETEPGKSREVTIRVRELEGVISANPVTGPYDVIAVVKCQRLDDIVPVVTGGIAPVPGVVRIVSCLAMGEDSTATDSEPQLKLTFGKEERKGPEDASLPRK